MKLLGFLLIVFSSLGCGICINAAKKDRMDDLISFSKMLDFMQAELLSHQSPLPYIAEKLSSHLDGRALEFICSFASNLAFLGELTLEDIWGKALYDTEPYLNDREISSLKSISSVLGKYDAEKQASVICEVRNTLTSSIEREQNSLSQYRKTALGISASAGTMLAVLLI